MRVFYSVIQGGLVMFGIYYGCVGDYSHGTFCICMAIFNLLWIREYLNRDAQQRLVADE